MGEMKRFSYPPCSTNPVTEKPFTRHKWVVPPGGSKKKGDLHYYRVRCSRCGFNDPNPPRY